MNSPNRKKHQLKKRQGIIFQSPRLPQQTDDQLADSRAQQKSLDADTNRKQVGTSESLNPSQSSFGPEHW